MPDLRIFLKPINLPVLCVEVVEVRLLAERFAGDFFDESMRGVLAAILMDMGFEPVADEGEVALGKLGLPVGMVVGKFFKELCSVEVAEGVGGEISHAAKRPVDVLETAKRVGGRGDAKEVVHFLIPDFGDIFYLEGSFDEHFFDFKPENHVEGVGDLIGFNADEGRFDGIDGEIELIKGDVFELGEGRLELGEEVVPEGTCAADACLPKARLAFIDAEGNLFAERCTKKLDG